MSEERYLQLMSFKMDDETIQDIFDMHDFFYMKLPKSLYKFFRQKKGSYGVSPHVKQLNDSLQYTFPQIFYADSQSNKYWLLSLAPIDTDLIELLLKQVMRSLGKQEWLLQEDEKLTWEKVKTVDYFEKRIHYQWIPAFFAKKFAGTGKKHLYIDPNLDDSGDYPILDKKVNFYPVKFHTTYECISDMIQRKNKDGQMEGSYSYVIKFSYNNRALFPEKGILNVKFGIRRYLERAIKHEYDVKGGKIQGSMLVGMDSPLLEAKKTFAHWRFSKVKGKIKWDKSVENFMRATKRIFNMNLDPSTILKNPHAYYEGESIVLPVYSDKVFQQQSLTGTKAGMGLQEKNYLFKLVKETFPFLSPLPRGREIKGARASKALTPFIVANQEMKAIRLEVWGPEHLKEHFLAQNAIFLEKAPHHDDVYLLDSEGEKLPIEIVQMDPKEIIRGKAEKEKDQSFINRVVDRLHMIKQSKDITTIALIEIETAEDYGGKQYDPKQLLRIAFAKTGRITQFIHPLEMKATSLEKESEERLKNSFKDLLSDLGLYAQGVRKSGIGSDIIYSVGMVSQQASILPIISYFSVNHPLQVQTYHTQTDDWQPFHKALTNCSKYKLDYFIKKYMAKDMGDNIWKFIVLSLIDLLKETEENVIVVLDDRYRSYNIREVQNAGLKKLYEFMQSMIPKEYIERLRFVRVSQHQEIPQYRIWDKKTHINYDSGLFSTNPNIYYSIALRMNNMRGVNKSSIKYSNVDRFYVHQSLVEIVTIACKTREESDDLARLIHQLRRAPITTDTGTIQPYPLHLNKSFKKYVAAGKKTWNGNYSFFDEEDHSFYDEVELEKSVAEQLSLPLDIE